MWFILLWFAIGFASVVTIWILDMRGKEYDESYFEQGGMLMIASIMTIFGFISPVIVLIVVAEDKKYFTKLMYKIANLGVKTDDTIEQKE